MGVAHAEKTYHNKHGSGRCLFILCIFRSNSFQPFCLPVCFFHERND